MSPLELIISRLSGVKKNGSNHRSNCPCTVHSKVNNNNLSIFENDDGSVGLHCHALCTASEVLYELELQLKDLFPAQTEVDRQQWIDRQAVINSENEKDKQAIKLWCELSVIKQAIQGRIFSGDSHPTNKTECWQREKEAIRLLPIHFKAYYSGK